LDDKQADSQISYNDFNPNSGKKIDKNVTPKKVSNKKQSRKTGFDKPSKNPESLSEDSMNISPFNQKKSKEAVHAKLVRSRDKENEIVPSPGDRLNSGRNTHEKISIPRFDAYFAPQHEDTVTHHRLFTPGKSNTSVNPMKPVIELPEKVLPTIPPRASESSKQPKLVIGQLRVEVVQEEAKAPTINPKRNVRPPSLPTRHHGGKIRSKLRFGLGQM
jgi:hypothetical protein